MGQQEEDHFLGAGVSERWGDLQFGVYIVRDPAFGDSRTRSGRIA
jgi:hypothetical protein